MPTTYLFFDTETTGLPSSYAPAEKVRGVWPNLVSIAWILTDERGHIMSAEYHLVKPEAWTIPESSVEIHKIDQPTATRYGRHVDEVIHQFLSAVEACDAIVAHNLYFDQNVINNILRWQFGHAKMLEHYRKKMICTMRERHTPGRKFAKLSEMYTELFGYPPDPDLLHNALGDTQILLKCFFKMRETAPPPPTQSKLVLFLGDHDLPAVRVVVANEESTSNQVAASNIPFADPSEAV